MKLSKAKRQQYRKMAEQHADQMAFLNFDIDELLDFVDSLEEDRDTLRSKCKLDKLIMAALQNLNESIIKLTTAVDSAVTALVAPPVTGVPEADVQAAADAVSAQTARLVTSTPTTTTPLGP